MDFLRAGSPFPDDLFYRAHARDHFARRKFARILAESSGSHSNVQLAVHSLRAAVQEENRVAFWTSGSACRWRAVFGRWPETLGSMRTTSRPTRPSERCFAISRGRSAGRRTVQAGRMRFPECTQDMLPIIMLPVMRYSRTFVATCACEFSSALCALPSQSPRFWRYSGGSE